MSVSSTSTISILVATQLALVAGGVALWLVALNPEALRVVERAPLGETLGHARMFHNLDEAVAAYQSQGRTDNRAGTVVGDGRSK